MSLYRIGLFSGFVGFLWWCFAVSTWAHGGGTPQLSNEVVGPYRLYAWSSPEPLRVGEVHLTLAVTLPPDEGSQVDESTLFNDLEKVVTGAEISVQFVSQSQPNNSVVAMARPSEINPLYYETDMELPFSDEWQVIINVSGESGQGDASFQSAVQESLRINWWWVTGIVAALFALIWVSRIRSNSHRGQARRATSR